MDDMDNAPGWALLGAGIAALTFGPVIAGLWWLLPDFVAGAAVRGMCAAMRAARGE